MLGTAEQFRGPCHAGVPLVLRDTAVVDALEVALETRLADAESDRQFRQGPVPAQVFPQKACRLLRDPQLCRAEHRPVGGGEGGGVEQEHLEESERLRAQDRQRLRGESRWFRAEGVHRPHVGEEKAKRLRTGADLRAAADVVPVCESLKVKTEPLRDVAVSSGAKRFFRGHGVYEELEPLVVAVRVKVVFRRELTGEGEVSLLLQHIIVVVEEGFAAPGHGVVEEQYPVLKSSVRSVNVSVRPVERPDVDEHEAHSGEEPYGMDEAFCIIFFGSTHQDAAVGQRLLKHGVSSPRFSFFIVYHRFFWSEKNVVERGAEPGIYQNFIAARREAVGWKL